MNRLGWIMIALIMFASCQFGDFKEPLIGNYELGARDEKEAMSIYVSDGQYLVGVVNATVFAVGYDNDFIIAKQHPRKFPNAPNMSIVNYFIIPLKFKVNKSLDENRIGPLTKREFEIKCKELGVSKSLGFSKVIHYLE